MNPFGAAAVLLSLVGFAATYRSLRIKSVRVRLITIAGLTLLSLPAVWFTAYYFHILPEYEWFYTFRSWTGTELLAVFVGCTAGAVASLLPRMLLSIPLFGALCVTAIPYIKPLVGPLEDQLFRDMSRGDICLQSTASTCGPASVTTILRRLGLKSDEKPTARAAYSYAGGTEAWYLARYVRSRGLVPRFVFRKTFTPEEGLPAVVGVRMGNAGHFIPVLNLNGDQVTCADPVRGEEHLSLAEFRRRYVFTGFHMVIQRP